MDYTGYTLSDVHERPRESGLQNFAAEFGFWFKRYGRAVGCCHNFSPAV